MARCSKGNCSFHTGLTGYQEVISDPSYAGQMVTFTTPHIGNYGASRLDDEAHRVHARGVIVREFARRRSNWRSDNDLDAYLASNGVRGIGGVDVGAGRFNVVAFDFGIKSTILTCLAEIATVRVVPASTTSDEVLAMKPDGVFLSNGPGDPEMVADAPATIRRIIDAGVPLFGICLGHQLLSRAMGARTYKLPFGHHGANHPVRNLATGSVEITSQNHNFCVDTAPIAWSR